MARLRYVSTHIMDAAAETAELLMSAQPDLREAWLDQVRTSEASDRAGGMIALHQPWDWPVAFLVWHAGYGGKLQRED